MDTKQQQKRQSIKLEVFPLAQKSRGCQLHVLENCLYVGVVIGWVLYYAILETWRVSEANVFNLRRSGQLVAGWNIFQIFHQDVSCIPWKFWKEFLANSLLPFAVAYILLGQIVSLVNQKRKYYISVIISSVMIGVTVGWQFLAFIMAFTSMGFLVSLLKRPSLVWLFTLGEILLFGIATISKQWLQYVSHPGLALVCLGTSSFRLFSFGLEYCKQAGRFQDQKQRINFNFTDLLKYNFYFPVFVAGPLMSYDQFMLQLQKRRSNRFWLRFRTSIPDVVLCLSVILLVEIATHFFYFYGLAKSASIVKNMNPSTAAGIIFWCVLHQYLIYFVLYEYSAAIARFDDLELPRPPACVFSYFTFRDYWRLADRGMYNMVVKYIYIPFVQTTPTLMMKSLGALCCFGFMAAWHGGERHHLLWATLCWLGIQVEVFAVVLFEMRFLKRITVKVPPQLSRRIQGLFWCPVFLLLVVVHMLLILGSSTWDILYILASQNDYMTWTMGLLFLYCLIQLCISRQMSSKSHRV
ncbi:protein-cysteine N-palmitoyltransferase HHAT-like [Apostichopus japonicus]|uniref:protein-cysteine N-palmitoyltransferase HHAT-like n=1 Tax=Stichopus japonicus TaxID=307972 RepID=UPI003AB1B4B9